jgi:LmbE family N-acetylglucosaminyl deacetylase
MLVHSKAIMDPCYAAWMDRSSNSINWISNMDIIAAFAHPDDETRFLGGTLAMLAAKGIRVHLLITTRGEGGETGEPPLCLQEDLGKVREDEMKCAANALGATSLSFLDYTDPTVAENGGLFPFKANLDTLVSQLETYARKHQASAIITHGSNGEYGHPAHKLMHRAVMTAAQRLGDIDVYTVSAMYEGHPNLRHANNNDRADFILSIQPWYSAKLEATKCHRTQHGLFIRRSSIAAGRQMTLAEVTPNEESLHHAWPKERSNGKDLFAAFLLAQCSEALIEK